MRNLKYFIYLDLVASITILATILTWELLVEGQSPGYLVSTVIALSLFSAVFCILSIAGIRLGHEHLVAKLWLFIFSLVLFYILLDIVGGLIFVHPTPFHNFPNMYVHHKMPPRMLYEMRDGFGDFDVTMITNNMGFRGRDITDKRPGKYRIVMLGDSFTMGEGVHDEDTFPLLMENYLNEWGGGKYDVVNLGVESYAPILEYSLLKRMIAMLKPNLVVLNFTMGDVLEEYAYRKNATFGADGDIISVDGYPEFNRVRTSLYERTFAWIRRHLFITEYVIEALRNHFEKPESNQIKSIEIRNVIENKNSLLLLHTLDLPQLKNSREIYDDIEDSILRMKRLCDRYGSKFVLNVYPDGHQVNDREWVPGRYAYIPAGVKISDRTVEELGRFSKENGILFFNAFGEFRAYNGDELLYYKHNGHWTPVGQKLMAKSLSEFLEEYLLKKD